MIRLGTWLDLARGDRTVDLLGPLMRPQTPPQWVHRPHGRALAARYAPLAAEWFTLTENFDECDVVVLPFGWDLVLVEPELREPGLALCRAAEEAGKVVLVFVDGDDHVPSPSANAVVFRTSLDRRRRGPNDVALPAWIPDPGRLPVRSHRVPPVVGFCGQAYPLGLPRGRWDKYLKFYGRVALTRLGIIERVGKHPAFAIRPRSVRALQHARSVQPRVVLRNGMTRLDLDTEQEHRLHDEYVEELAASDYVLCVRGEGNYSFRLYEAMAAGRIPVLIDTDAVLPLESVVQWHELCVVVAARDARRAADVVAATHARLDDHSFAERQSAVRSAWDTWLSMAGFFGFLRARLEEQLVDGRPLVATEVAATLR